MSIPAAVVNVCAACGVELGADRGPSGGLGVFFRGRRYDLCGPACRLAFKRDPEGAIARHPEAGREPEATCPVPVPAPSARRGPFTVLGKGPRG